jgi:hypothetical protein
LGINKDEKKNLEYSEKEEEEELRSYDRRTKTHAWIKKNKN